MCFQPTPRGRNSSRAKNRRLRTSHVPGTAHGHIYGGHTDSCTRRAACYPTTLPRYCPTCTGVV